MEKLTTLEQVIVRQQGRHPKVDGKELKYVKKSKYKSQCNSDSNAVLNAPYY